jgi:hypothetical protein
MTKVKRTVGKNIWKISMSGGGGKDGGAVSNNHVTV